MKKLIGLMLLVAGLQFSAYVSAQTGSEEGAAAGTQTTEENEYLTWARNIWESLDRQTGTVEVKEAKAVLTIPESFYYLNAKDSEKVLVEVWGNPPGQTVLGMLFPAESTPFDQDAWAVTIEYEEDGYVSDSDADDIDYSSLLKQMKKDTKAESKLRQKEGYDAIELVGWAAQPFYDKQEKKLHWAKEIRFASSEVNTLNYNIRVLGRRGVLVLNFIAGIDQKELIDQNLDSVLSIANFEEGSGYADFNPDVDKVAAYGLGALVAGKLAAKAGILAGLLIFLKKFGVFIFIGIAALFQRIFRKK